MMPIGGHPRVSICLTLSSLINLPGRGCFENKLFGSGYLPCVDFEAPAISGRTTDVLGGFSRAAPKCRGILGMLASALPRKEYSVFTSSLSFEGQSKALDFGDLFYISGPHGIVETEPAI